MSLLTTPSSSSSTFFLLKPQKLNRHNSNSNSNSLSSFSLFPSSSTPLLSLSSTRPSSTTFSIRASSSSDDDDDKDDEWGKEPKPKPNPNPSSFTVGTSDANITFNLPDVWGSSKSSGSKPESKPAGSDPPESKSKSKPKPKNKPPSFTVGTPDANVSLNVPDVWGKKSEPEPESKPENKPSSFTVGTPDANVTLNVPDIWGKKSEPEPEPESKPENKPSSFTVGTPDANVTLNVPDVWGEKSEPESKPKPKSKPDEPEKEKDKPEPESKDDPTSFTVGTPDANVTINVPDEWGEKPDFMPETKFPGPDPAVWEGPLSKFDQEKKEEMSSPEENKNYELKRCLLDTVYGSELGFRASAEVRAEVSELVTQLEAVNPSPNPTEVSGLLDGNWVLVYTAFSELLPLLAVGATPLLKIDQISQAINTASQVVENSTTISSPFATFSFSATASFDVRSSSRIQVRFKEATFKPPEIKSRFDLPANIEVFGQTVTLSPVQQLLNPVQEAAASISRSLYGLPPLKIPIPGERTTSWLLFTYVDEDFRISRGDGGIFVLVREGSPLLDQ